MSVIFHFTFYRKKGDTTIHYTPIQGRFGFSERTKDVESVSKALVYCFWAALTLSNTGWSNKNQNQEIVLEMNST
jgi:hypothetical protein